MDYYLKKIGKPSLVAICDFYKLKLNGDQKKVKDNYIKLLQETYINLSLKTWGCDALQRYVFREYMSTKNVKKTSCVMRNDFPYQVTYKWGRRAAGVNPHSSIPLIVLENGKSYEFTNFTLRTDKWSCKVSFSGGISPHLCKVDIPLTLLLKKVRDANIYNYMEIDYILSSMFKPYRMLLMMYLEKYAPKCVSNIIIDYLQY